MDPKLADVQELKLHPVSARKPISKSQSKLENKSTNLKLPFNPISRLSLIEDKIIQGDKRIYGNLAKFSSQGKNVIVEYVGCPFLCAYCWNVNRNEKINLIGGTFFTPNEVATKVSLIPHVNEIETFTFSGAEPILGANSCRHLLQVIDLIHIHQPKVQFIIETNGLALGLDLDLSKEIAKREEIIVRVSIKGTTPEQFEAITGAQKSVFELPIKAIVNLTQVGVETSIVIVRDVFKTPELIDELKTTVKTAGCSNDILTTTEVLDRLKSSFVMDGEEEKFVPHEETNHLPDILIDIEDLRYLPGVQNRMKERKIKL